MSLQVTRLPSAKGSGLSKRACWVARSKAALMALSHQHLCNSSSRTTWGRAWSDDTIWATIRHRAREEQQDSGKGMGVLPDILVAAFSKFQCQEMRTLPGTNGPRAHRSLLQRLRISLLKSEESVISNIFSEALRRHNISTQEALRPTSFHDVPNTLLIWQLLPQGHCPRWQQKVAGKWLT